MKNLYESDPRLSSREYFLSFSHAIEKKITKLRKPGDTFVFGRLFDNSSRNNPDIDMSEYINVDVSPVPLSSLGPTGGRITLKTTPDGNPFFEITQNDINSNMDTSLNGSRFSRNNHVDAKPGDIVGLSFQGIILELKIPHLDDWNNKSYSRDDELTQSQISRLDTILGEIRGGNHHSIFKLREFLPGSVANFKTSDTLSYRIHPFGNKVWELQHLVEFVKQQKEAILTKTTYEPNVVIHENESDELRSKIERIIQKGDSKEIAMIHEFLDNLFKE